MRAIFLFLVLLSSLSMYSQIENTVIIDSVNKSISTKAPQELDTLFIGVEHRDPR